MKLTFQLQLTTDYHIGAGHGLGSQVDAALLREGDGLPVLRGSTLEGLLRDGMWRLLQMPPLAAHFQAHRAEELRRHATRDEVVAWCADAAVCPLCRVFGTPGAPKRWRISSARPDGAEKFLRRQNAWSAGQEGAQVAARVRVNPRLRRAEDRKLFKQEEGDARLSFTFTATCADDEQALDEAALLTAAARMVRRLGSARRRGRGECSLHLLNVEADEGNTLTADMATQTGLLSHFKNWLAADALRPRLTRVIREWQSPTEQKDSSATAPVRRWLMVKLDEPLLLAKRAQAGNEFETVEQIPGVAVLGALAARAAERWQLAQADVQSHLYQTFVALFKNGAAQFGPLYPTKAGDSTVTPAIPAPLDWLTCKVYPGFDRKGRLGHGAMGYASADAPPTDCPACNKEDNADIPLIHYEGFHSVSATTEPVEVRRREEMHPRTNPHTQRVARGNLFGYVALESGQFFLGEIRCQDKAAWAALLKLIGLEKGDEPFQLRLGKATRRGYGLVSARLLEPKLKPKPVDPWRGQPLEERVTAATTQLTLTLLSDAIVPDVWGRFRQTLDGAYLRELIGARFVAEDNPIQAFCKTRFVDNFNNQLGLPRWRDVALRVGSSVGIRLHPPVDAAERHAWLTDLQKSLRQIEADGIGLRRHEGFGQVVFNHPLYQAGQGTPDTTLNIPPEWRPVQSYVQGFARTAQATQQTGKDWKQDKLRKFDETLFHEAATPTNEEEQNWTAVARWLHSAAAQPLAELQTQLLAFGSPTLLTAEPRDKESFFAKERGQKSLAYLSGLLAEIASRSYSAELQQLLVEMLAQRLAEAVKKGES